MALNDRNRVIRNRGKKLIKYLEEIKWKILNNLQHKYSPPVGRMKMPSRIREFLRDFEKKNKHTKRTNETSVRGR
jgi:hypothetical protein